ncbi:MAG: hypothetical protein LBJ01_00580 [Tannerella sp.]|jgi:hypothetical protein|nr:hypothetical protein [Tannerella sp.]
MKRDASAAFFRDLKEDALTYAALKLELLKLGAYERTGKVISVLSYGLILLILALFLMLFSFIALAFFLGDWLHSPGLGFALVSVLYLLIIGGVLLCRQMFRKMILNTVISALTSNENNNNEATSEENPAGEAVGA